MAELTKVVVTTGAGNVAIAADFENEVHCMTITEPVVPGEMQEAFKLVARLGLEIMDEDECPADTINGNVVVWLAQVGEPEWP